MEESEKEWKEKTKLNATDKQRIAVYIIMFVFEIVAAVITTNIAWITCGLLWICMGVMEYCNTKTKKAQNAIIEIQQECINTQKDIIKQLLLNKEWCEWTIEEH